MIGCTDWALDQPLLLFGKQPMTRNLYVKHQQGYTTDDVTMAVVAAWQRILGWSADGLSGKRLRVTEDVMGFTEGALGHLLFSFGKQLTTQNLYARHP